MKHVALFLCLLLLINSALAQHSKDAFEGIKGIKDPVTTFFRGDMKIAGDHFGHIAGAMPAEKYTFRPTPKERAFTELLVNVIQQN